MAISHAQPLLLLLVSLFFLPALSNTTFQKCNTGRQYPVEVKTVEISPDPVNRKTNGNVTITGYTSKEIPDGVSVKLRLSIFMPVSSKSYSLCDITACPVAPGPIVLTLSNIFTEREIKAFRYLVSISITEEHQKEKMMCIVFGCQIKGYTSLLSQATE